MVSEGCFWEECKGDEEQSIKNGKNEVGSCRRVFLKLLIFNSRNEWKTWKKNKSQVTMESNIYIYI